MYDDAGPMNVESIIHRDRYFISDAEFDTLYPHQIQKLAKRHWTPLRITRLVVDFLATKGSKVLDIGSGVGKFCLAGAYSAPEVKFIGVEQRQSLVDYAIGASHKLGLPNAYFINANFTQLDLRHYDHFYFYNAFYENIDGDERIDDSIAYSASLYKYYMRYLFNELRNMPLGTRIATYHCSQKDMPDCYRLIETYAAGQLHCWMKL
jgi:SAM-dependent methyltransferase